ncbi:MAG: hypothetical protein PUG91_08125 [Clostridiales bacterium]|nr:hypothetical protein [Clostridiales bacterium]MDD7367243.1 hypothetical protein [Clostridiales bacterium]
MGAQSRAFALKAPEKALKLQLVTFFQTFFRARLPYAGGVGFNSPPLKGRFRARYFLPFPFVL